MLLRGFISPRCLCLGKTISSELLLRIVHNNHKGNFSPKTLNTVQQGDVVVTHAGLMTVSSYSDSNAWVYH